MMHLMGNHLSLNSLLPECGGSDGATHACTRPACTLTVPPLNWWIRHHRNITMRTPDSRRCKTLMSQLFWRLKSSEVCVFVYGGYALALSCSTTSAWWNNPIQALKASRQNMHVLLSWLVMCSSPFGPSHHLPLFEVLVPNTLWTWCVRLISQCFYFCNENLRKLAFTKWWHWATSHKSTLKEFVTQGNSLSFLLGSAFMFVLSLLNSSVDSPPTPPEHQFPFFAPISPSVQVQSCPSHLSHLFKDGCAGRRLAGWSDGLWR